MIRHEIPFIVFIDLGNITYLNGKNMYEKIAYKFSQLDENIKISIDKIRTNGTYIYDSRTYIFDSIYDNGYVYVQGFSATGVNNFKMVAQNGELISSYSINT